jgi:hypothetical protein
MMAAVRLGGGRAFAGLAGWKCARSFVARLDVQAIEYAEVRIADNFKTPEQSQTKCTADSAGNFLDQLAAAERRDANLDPSFLFAGFHCY